MKKNKLLRLSGLLLLVTLVLSGCARVDRNGQPYGMVWDIIGKPMANSITYLAENQALGYGVAMIIVILVVRAIIFPLGLYQAWKSSYQSEKMTYLKPVLEPVQERMRNAKTPEEQAAAQQEYFAVQKANGMGVLGGMGATGCLPLFIQMPFFSAIFVAARYTPGIADATWLGLHLGTPNFILTILAGILYFGQSWLMIQGVSEEQRAQMKSMMYINPITIIFFSLSSPASVQLYWILGGVIGLVQQAITSFIIKPRMRKKVADEFAANPPQMPKANKVAKDVTPQSHAVISTTKKSNRNAGKQRTKR